MEMRNLCYSLATIIVCSGSCSSGEAATVAASALTPTAVQTAINSALSGDTVTLPAGSATWTTGVTITNKSIRLVGAGIDRTIITRSTTSNGIPALSVTLRPLLTDTFYLVGITWNTVNPPQFGIVNVGNSNSLDNPVSQFRITNCKFTHTPTNGSSAQGTRSVYISGAYGLIDHCTFTSTSSAGGQMITVSTDNYSDGASWHSPQFLGDTKCVCMEDNVFSGADVNDGAFDAYPGQRIVFRHNKVTNTCIGWHGYDSSVRSCRSFEIYQNTFTTTAGHTGLNGIYIRGGTGVIWSNSFDAGFASFVAFNLYASDHVFTRPTAIAPTGWGTPPPGGPATGSNAVDGNFVGPGQPDQGYPLLDQPGRGSFPVGNAGNWPNVTTGYTQATFEALDPIYQWNNTLGANASPTCGVNIPTTANYVKANRDYYDNVQKPGYTPLVYPHPLTQGDPVTLAPPSNLTIQ